MSKAVWSTSSSNALAALGGALRALRGRAAWYPNDRPHCRIIAAA